MSSCQDCMGSPTCSRLLLQIHPHRFMPSQVVCGGRDVSVRPASCKSRHIKARKLPPPHQHPLQACVTHNKTFIVITNILVSQSILCLFIINLFIIIWALNNFTTLLECCLSHEQVPRYACKSKSLLLLQHSADCAAVYGVGISLQCCSEGCLRMSAYVPSTGQGCKLLGLGLQSGSEWMQ